MYTFQKKIQAIISMMAILYLTGCGSSPLDTNAIQTLDARSPTQGKLFAFYGDTQLNRILAIDVEKMELVTDIPTTGVTPYTVGRAGNLDKLYAITRGSQSIDVIDIKTLEIIKTIPLKHSPRSCAFNEYLGLQLVSGKDKPMSSLIDVATDEVVAVVGRNELVTPLDFGGSNATGHPMWLTPDIFALLDREKRKIELYKVKKVAGKWEVTYLSKLCTPTSAHHFIGKGFDGMDTGILLDDAPQDTFYLVTEGAPQERISPKLLEVKLEGDHLSIKRTVSFGCKNVEDMGSHHGTFHPDGKHVYMGSREGKMHVIDIVNMKLEKSIITGKGSGHTTFIPQRNLAIVTNHHDTFITIVDTTTNTKIKDLNVSGASINGTILQSHTSFTDLNGDFFYAFATDNGIFYEVDLDTLEVSRTLYTGGTPKQGCSVILE